MTFTDEITDLQGAFIAGQAMFFVGTAAPAGARVNISPKGMDTLRVLDAHTVAYLDLTGSGNETAAHLMADGRMTIMLNSFGVKPNIMRLYGTGRIVGPQDDGWVELAPLFPDLVGTRQIIVLDVESVQESCGYAVPRMELVEERRTLDGWHQANQDTLDEYRATRNAASIDGLPTPLS